MIRRFKKYKQERVFYRTNERITALNLRVLDANGKQIGVLNLFEALKQARDQGLDLVEIAPTAKPPVAKIIDYKKFLYQQEKKKKEEKKKTKVSETKEIRLGPFMDDHDLAVMIRRSRECLQDNDKVRLVVRFLGRQIAHPEFGQQTMRKVIHALSDLGKIEKDPHFEGKQLISIVTPDRKKGKADEKVEEVSQQTV